jgi:hypothetical protein
MNMNANVSRSIIAFRGLESLIHDLSVMADIAATFIAEAPHLPGLTEEQERNADRDAFLVLRIAKMAEDLRQAWRAAVDADGRTD